MAWKLLPWTKVEIKEDAVQGSELPDISQGYNIVSVFTLLLRPSLLSTSQLHCPLGCRMSAFMLHLPILPTIKTHVQRQLLLRILSSKISKSDDSAKFRPWLIVPACMVKR